ncbi:universal stress protein [Daejeonella sp.]|uniref:universal stress protein n=1 Tax=Daejeonella sp. TaxID=2805397 RepID=UPI0039830EEF
MKKILVTTDFSANSKAGLRFAIQLASQNKYELVFFHSYYVMKPTTLSAKVFVSYEKSEANKIKNRLCRFVDSAYSSMGINSVNFSCITKSSFITDANIMEYALKNKFDFICISRRGNGKHNKIFGTNTSILINQSDVPVIAVPNTYLNNKITSILYASDLSSFENETQKVIDFAKPLGAKIELLHFKFPSDLDRDPKLIQKAIKKFTNQDIKVRFDDFDFVESLVLNLDKEIKKLKPSILVMFTQQNRSFFERLFLSSSSAQYSLKSKVPLLVYKKI